MDVKVETEPAFIIRMNRSEAFCLENILRWVTQMIECGSANFSPQTDDLEIAEALLEMLREAGA